MRAARQAGDLAKRGRRDRIVTLLKQEGGNAAHAEFSRRVADLVDLLFEAVADEDQRVDALLVGGLDGVAQHLAQLGTPAEAADLNHAADQLVGRRHPRARLALPEPAIEDELDIEPAEPVRRLEHLRLEMAGPVPSRLAARRRVHGEQQPAASRRPPHRRRGRPNFQKKGDQTAVVQIPHTVVVAVCGHGSFRSWFVLLR